jgi:hypothetical protein
MTDNELTRQKHRSRRGRLPIPVTIGLLLAVVIVAVLVFNAYFYGRAVMLLERRVVLADIEDFPQFLHDCRDDPTSSYEIVTMRDEPDGNFLLLRLQLLLKYIYEKRGTQVGQVVLRGQDFELTSGNETWPAVLLGEGYEGRGEEGATELVIRSLTFRRGANGGIEEGAAGAGSVEEHATVGDVVRGVKQLHMAASSGRGPRGVLDWVRAPLAERAQIIQPPGLFHYIWRAEPTQNKDDAWRAAEAVCLFPLPPPGTNATLVVFGDNTTAIPITVR